MKSTKIYDLDKTILHSSFPNNCANLDEIIIKSDHTYDSDSDTDTGSNITNTPMLESFTSSNTDSSSKSTDDFNIDKNPDSSIDCTPVKQKYSQIYTIIHLFTDWFTSLLGKTDSNSDIVTNLWTGTQFTGTNKACMNNTEMTIIQNKISVIRNINSMIVRYIITIISLLYLFNVSTAFGSNYFPKVLFSIFIILFPKGFIIGIVWLLFVHNVPLIKQGYNFILNIVYYFIAKFHLHSKGIFFFLRPNYYFNHLLEKGNKSLFPILTVNITENL